jgi:hypothetical protein
MKNILIMVAIGLSLMIFILPLFCLFLAFLEGRNRPRTG